MSWRGCGNAADLALVRRLAFGLLLAAGTAGAQTEPRPGETRSERSAAPAPDSPRASLADYLELCREGRFDDAARYLELQDTERPRGALLARKLKAVLDRHLWLDLDLVSPQPSGNETDGWPRGTDQIGSVPSAGGRAEPVRLVRAEDPAEPR